MNTKQNEFSVFQIFIINMFNSKFKRKEVFGMAKCGGKKGKGGGGKKC